MNSVQPQPVAVLRGDNAEVQALVFLSEDVLATGDAEGEVLVWNLQDARPVSRVRLHTAGNGGILHLEAAELAGQQYLLSQGRDMGVDLWSLPADLLLPRDPLLKIRQLSSSTFCRSSLLEPPPIRQQRHSAHPVDQRLDGTAQQSEAGVQESAAAAAACTQTPPLLMALPADDNTSVQLWCCCCRRQLGAVGGQHSREQKWGMCTSLKLFREERSSRAFLAVGYEAGWVAVWALGAQPGTWPSCSEGQDLDASATLPAALVPECTHAGEGTTGAHTPAGREGQERSGTGGADCVERAAAEGGRGGAGAGSKPGIAEEPHTLSGEGVGVTCQQGASPSGRAVPNNGCWCCGHAVGVPSHPMLARQLHEEPVLALDIEGDGSRGVSGGADSRLVFFQLDTTADVKPCLGIRRVARLKNPGINDVSVRADGRIVATAGWDGRVRIFSCRSAEPLAILKYHRSAVSEVKFSYQTGLLASASRDGTVALWSVYRQT